MMYMLGLISYAQVHFYKHTLKWPFHPPIGLQISLNGDKNMRAVPGRPDWGRKMFATPI